MRIAPVADVKARLSAYLEEADRRGPVVITKNGRPVGVLVAPADDDDLERLLLGRSPRFQRMLAKSRRSVASGRGLSHDAFWKKVSRAPWGRSKKLAPAAWDRRNDGRR